MALYESGADTAEVRGAAVAPLDGVRHRRILGRIAAFLGAGAILFIGGWVAWVVPDDLVWTQPFGIVALALVGLGLLLVGLTITGAGGTDLVDAALGLIAFVLAMTATALSYGSDGDGWWIAVMCVASVLLAGVLVLRVTQRTRPHPVHLGARLGPGRSTPGHHLVAQLADEIAMTSSSAGRTALLWTIAYLALALAAPLGSAAAVVSSQSAESEDPLTTVLAAIGAVAAAGLATLNPAQRANEAKTLRLACDELIRQIRRSPALDAASRAGGDVADALEQWTRRYEEMLRVPTGTVSAANVFATHGSEPSAAARGTPPERSGAEPPTPVDTSAESSARA